MKHDRLSKYIKGWYAGIVGLFGRRNARGLRNPRRYRLDFIAENTFNRVWTVRFSRLRVVIVSLTVVAAIAALAFVILYFSPINRILPGRLEGDLRSRYVDMALKLDSLERQSRINEAWLGNVMEILSGDMDPEKARKELTAGMTVSVSDSLLLPSDAERRFVKSYEDAERFNLSVLTPIAAEGMAFYSPAPGALSEAVVSNDLASVVIDEPGLLSVSASYRGTVVGSFGGNGRTRTLVIQHPNDFVSVYSGLAETFVSTGDKVKAGQRIGHSGRGNAFRFELWHNGSAANPTDYIGF